MRKIAACRPREGRGEPGGSTAVSRRPRVTGMSGSTDEGRVRQPSVPVGIRSVGCVVTRPISSKNDHDDVAGGERRCAAVYAPVVRGERGGSGAERHQVRPATGEPRVGGAY